MSVASEILDYLDGLKCAVSLTILIETFPQFSVEDIKEATKQLYTDRRLNRVSIKGKGNINYYVFYSLYIQTVPRFDGEADKGWSRTVPPMPSPAYDSIPSPVWEPIPSVPEAPETPPAADQALLASEVPLSPDEAVAVLEKAGWQAGPEVVERRVADRRTLTALDVIDRWKLPYRLSRIIEILASARKVKLDADDAAAIAGLVREHVKKEQP